MNTARIGRYSPCVLKQTPGPEPLGRGIEIRRITGYINLFSRLIHNRFAEFNPLDASIVSSKPFKLIPIQKKYRRLKPS